MDKLISKINQNARVAYYGAGTTGKKILDYIKENRKDIHSICFFDLYKEDGSYEGLPLYSVKRLQELKDTFDVVLITVSLNSGNTVALFDCLDIKYVLIDYNTESRIRNLGVYQKYKDVLNIFHTESDKELYQMLVSARENDDYTKVSEYAYNKYNIKPMGFSCNLEAQYFEYINFENIQNVIECGAEVGMQILLYKKKFKNLKHIFAFDPIRDIEAIPAYDYYLNKINELEFLPYAILDKVGSTDFYINSACYSGSFVSGSIEYVKDSSRYVKKTVKTISIDELCSSRNLDRLDFIKMDIEGSEPLALKGGKESILKYRPQLAISIYHSGSDFINIPLYLSELLKDSDYIFRLGHYSSVNCETVLYAIPRELYQEKYN